MRLIDTDAIVFTHAITRSIDDGHNWNELCVTKDEIDDMPSVELTERTAKIYQKQAPDRLYYFYCGVCGEMIDCSSYEDYKSIKPYCGYCGAKLDWSE